MPTFYHVDRAGQLHSGQVLNLLPPTFARNESRAADLFDLLGDGLSDHGLHYLNSKSDPQFARDFDIELLLERFRLSYLPTAPSRFHSWFAFETQNDAMPMYLKYLLQPTPIIVNGRNPIGLPKIWIVNAADSFRADMNWLAARTNLENRVKQYWTQSNSTKPQWELLLTPPVEVVEVVAP